MMVLDPMEMLYREEIQRYVQPLYKRMFKPYFQSLQHFRWRSISSLDRLEFSSSHKITFWRQGKPCAIPSSLKKPLKAFKQALERLETQDIYIQGHLTESALLCRYSNQQPVDRAYHALWAWPLPGPVPVAWSFWSWNVKDQVFDLQKLLEALPWEKMPQGTFSLCPQTFHEKIAQQQWLAPMSIEMYIPPAWTYPLRFVRLVRVQNLVVLIQQIEEQGAMQILGYASKASF